MTSTSAAPRRLDSYQAGRVERARKALEASAADRDGANFPRWLGVLEVTTGDLLEIIDSLTG
jgi:hypothetical protein